MKRILLITTLFVITVVTANAQFKLTPSGLVSLENPDKNYIVLEFKGKSQQELYNAVNVYMHSLYVSPQDVVSAVSNEAITINGISESEIKLRKAKSRYDIKYTISLAFKDGRIRVKAPYIVDMYKWLLSNKKYEYSLNGLGYPFYTGVYRIKDDKLIDEIAKESIEVFFNSYIGRIKSYIEDDNKAVGDDW